MALSLRKTKHVPAKYDAPPFVTPLEYEAWKEKMTSGILSTTGTMTSGAATTGTSGMWGTSSTPLFVGHKTGGTMSGTWSSTGIGTSWLPSVDVKEANRRAMEAVVNAIVHGSYPDADLTR